MSSGWVFGAIELPKPPNRITKKAPVTLQKIPVYVEAPWLMHMGADVKQLQWNGEVFQEGKTISNIFASYIRPLERYAEKPMAIAIPLMDINPTGSWSGSGVTTIKNTESHYVKNDECLYVKWGAEAKKIYNELDDFIDFSNHNLISFWVRGTSSDKFKVTLYNEAYASGLTNGYRFYISCNNHVWSQAIVSTSSSDGLTYVGNVGTPEGWDKIRTITVEPSGFDPATGDYYFDMMAIGVGWEVDTPNNFYDGIWLIKDFQYEEQGGEIFGFDYKLQMMEQTEFYGRKYKVV